MYELTSQLTKASQTQRCHVSDTPLEAEVRMPSWCNPIGLPSPPKGIRLVVLGVGFVGEASLPRRKAGQCSRAGHPDDCAMILSASQIVRSDFVSRCQIVGLSPHR